MVEEKGFDKIIKAAFKIGAVDAKTLADVLHHASGDNIARRQLLFRGFIVHHKPMVVFVVLKRYVANGCAYVALISSRSLSPA